MNRPLEKKRALVTGGSRGIGAAVVVRLARDGADVALTYVSNPDQANETARAARALGVKALAIRADSADAKAVVDAVEQTARELGGIDILINNAGVAVIAPIDDYRLEDLDRTLAVNVRAVFVAIQSAVRHMQAGGRIINIGSCNAERMPFTGGGVYAMSKAALVGLVKGLARDLWSARHHDQQRAARPCGYRYEPCHERFRQAAGAADGNSSVWHRRRDRVAGCLSGRTDTAYVTGASLTIDGGFTA